MDQKDIQPKKTTAVSRFVPFLVLVLLILIAMGLGARIRSEKDSLAEEKANAISQERPPVNVVVQELRPRVQRDRLNLPGMIEPWERLDILAEVPGTVKEVLVEEGSHVNQGDLIARIDTSDYENTINSVTAAYNLADINLKRLTALREQEIIALAELDKARAEVDSLKAQLAIAREQLGRCYIRSSLNGIVNTLPAKKGLYLGVGDPVATVLEIGRVKAVVGIPESDVAAVRKIDRFEATIDALQNKKVAGVKYFLAVAPDSLAQVYRLELAVDNASEEILPGMFARIEIVKQEFPDALAVPLYAVITRDNRHYVFVEENGVARFRQVGLGILDGWLIQITEGLAPGERVIVVGQRSVDDGQGLNVVKTVTDPAEITK